MTELGNHNAGIVIVGAGIAGVQAAEGLRKAGYDGALTLVGAEPHMPYDRPPLSKEVLLRAGAENTIALRDENFFAANKIDVMLGKRVCAIERPDRRVVLEDGSRLDYVKLVLATGSRPRVLAGLSPQAPGVFYLRTLADSLMLRATLARGGRVAIVGGGVIGLEVAAVAAGRGLAVTVIEAASRVMARAASPVIGAYLAKRHQEHGVAIRCGVSVDSARQDGDGCWRLALNDGCVVEAEIVVVGVGVVPETSLAGAAGLQVAKEGVVTDGFGRTDDSNIYAAGEVAYHVNGLEKGRQRQENWHHAAAHGAHVGRALIAPDTCYSEICGYWSDQYDTHLMVSGLPAGDVDVVRGDVTTNRFVVFHLVGGVVAGASAVNAAPELRVAKLLVRNRARVPASELQDPSTDLRKVAA
jgi:3-phenylpropionate/trans-cinnamate dioxygenase ferredoxin reductase component